MRTPFASVFPASAVLALAAGCGTAAQAQSSVQIYGLLDLSVGSFRDSGSNGRSSQLASGKLTTSYLGYKGQEDLGGGMSAFFVLESHLRVDTGETGRNATDPFFSRNSFVGIGGAYGSLAFGRSSTPVWIAALSSNPFVGSTGFSPSLRLLFGPTGKTGGDGVWSNSIVYNTPKLGGFSAAVQHQLKETAQGGNTGANVLYSNGPLALTVAAQRVEVPYASGGETTGLVGGSYDFGVVRLFGQYAQVKEGATRVAATANTRDKIYQVGASIPVGAASVLVSYAEAKTTGARPGQREFFSLGYDYRLSKRTDIYTVAMFDKLNTAGRANTFAVGVRHTF